MDPACTVAVLGAPFALGALVITGMDQAAAAKLLMKQQIFRRVPSISED